MELVDYGARWYDPRIGRFISPDTIIPNPANPQSLNRYSYSYGNPIKYVDSNGHFPVIPILIAAAIVVAGMAMDPADVLAPNNELAVNHPPLNSGYHPAPYIKDFENGAYAAGAIGVATEFIPGNDLPGRKTIIGALENVVSPHIKKLREVFGEDALIGFRGSLATGVKGPHKLAQDGSRLPFDPTNFDIDAFIVSDKLAELYGNQRMRWGDRIGTLDDLSIEIQEALKELPEFEGLRDKGFSFRIFTQEEADRIFDGTEHFFTEQ